MQATETNQTTVRDLMVRKARAISPEAPAALAALVMVEADIRHLVVTTGSHEVVGILSERNVLKHLSPWLSKIKRPGDEKAQLPRSKVRDIMVPDPITISGNAPIHLAARILGARKIGCLPVVRGQNRLIGILTAVDLLRYIGRTGGT